MLKHHPSRKTLQNELADPANSGIGGMKYGRARQLTSGLFRDLSPEAVWKIEIKHFSISMPLHAMRLSGSYVDDRARMEGSAGACTCGASRHEFCRRPSKTTMKPALLGEASVKRMIAAVISPSDGFLHK